MSQPKRKIKTFDGPLSQQEADKLLQKAKKK
jgi:hypothetical protein